MYPVSIEAITRVADMGKNMPPKSTWFEPKPREGFILRIFNTIINSNNNNNNNNNHSKIMNDNNDDNIMNDNNNNSIKLNCS